MNSILKIAYNHFIMDISKQIEDLWKEHEELEAHKKDIHKRMVGIRTRIGKLKTIQKKAEEVLNPESPAELEQEISKNLK